MPEIKVCPKCHKPVEANDYKVSFLILLGGVDPRFKCRKCKYTGPIITLSDEESDYRE